MQKNLFLKNLFFVGIAKVNDEFSKRHGSADPDPLQNVMDPQHWLKEMVGPPLTAPRPSPAAAVLRGLASLQQPAPLDPVQEALLAEPCILVDRNDRVIGQVTVEVQIGANVGASLLVLLLNPRCASS